MARVFLVAGFFALLTFALVAVPSAAADPGPGCVEMDDGYWYCAVHADGDGICIVYQEYRWAGGEAYCGYRLRPL